MWSVHDIGASIWKNQRQMTIPPRDDDDLSHDNRSLGGGPGRVGTRVVDDVDRAILRELTAEGRLSVNELAGRVNVSRATAYKRVARLEADGVITGYTALVDPHAAGRDLAALLLITVAQAHWRVVRDQLTRLPGLEYLGLAAGRIDFVALVRVADVNELRDVVLDRLHEIDGVQDSQTLFLLDEDGHPAVSRWPRPAA